MPLFQDPAAFQKRLAGLPIMTCEAGEDVLRAGAKSGKLLFLKSGAVEVTKDGVQIAQVSTAGAVFGELAALLDQSHTADVRALEPSEFLVADAPTLLAIDPAIALYVAAILAQRLDSANRALLDVKRQLRAGESRSAIARKVEKVEELLMLPMDASLVYAGYPYDPFARQPTA
jgi:CRP/FNR family transcriptional regulator, cyclic AMP receptor protein